MFLYELFIGLTIIAIGLTNPIENILSYQAPRCCPAKQFSGKSNVTSHSPGFDGIIATSYVIYEYASDEIRGLYAMKGYSQVVPYNVQSDFWIIHDLNSEIMYSIVPQYNHCEKLPNKRMQATNCISEQAIYINTTNVEYNGEQILSDTWLIQTGDSLNYFTHSRDKCIPLKAEHFFGNSPVSTSSVSIDYNEYIVDPTIFDIPSECN